MTSPQLFAVVVYRGYEGRKCEMLGEGASSLEPLAVSRNGARPLGRKPFSVGVNFKLHSLIIVSLGP
jgi:hypothetical protein